MSQESLARLMAAATHDMRNALAVIRESTGLSLDILGSAQAQESHKERVQKTLEQVSVAVQRAALLTAALEHLQELALMQEDQESSDVNALLEEFCLLMERTARAHKLHLDVVRAKEKVQIPVRDVTIFTHLLAVFDVCIAAGGAVTVRFIPVRQKDGYAIMLSLVEGSNEEPMLAALTTCSKLLPAPKGWFEQMLPKSFQNDKKFLMLVE